MLSACGGGGGGGNDDPDGGNPPDPTDTEAPSLSITSPTSAASHDSDSASITLGGEASDNQGVTEVTWQCTGGCGGSGNASGTTDWSTGSIDLAEGDNTIVVTARDAAGNAGSDSITVSYEEAPPPNKPVSPITDADATPNSVDETAPAGTAVGITAHATDADEGDTVDYELTADSSGGLFRIDPQTGVVSLVNTGLDYETAQSHTITVVANSSDGSSSEADFTIEVIDNNTPMLSVAFPPDGALFNGDAITVRGTFKEASSIEVSRDTGNAIAAQLDYTTGTWAARLPVWGTAGNKVTFSVTARGGGELATATRTLRTDTLIGHMGALVFDGTQNQLIVADNQNARLVRIDMENWTQSVLSGDYVGNGESLGSIAGMVMDPTGGRVLLTDTTRNAVVAVDLDSGDREVISGAGIGTGTNLRAPAGLAMRGEDILLVDSLSQAVIEIDAASGNRTVLSGRDVGNGELPGRATAIVLTNPNDLSTAHVIDALHDRLFAIDLETGDRTVYGNTTPGTGRFGDEAQVALLDGNIFAIDTTGGKVIRVNPLDGTRLDFSDSVDDKGPYFQSLSGIVFVGDNNGGRRLLATDAIKEKVFAFDDLGNRQLTPVNAVGEGELILDGSGQIEFDPVAARLYYRDQISAIRYDNLGVLSIDAKNGNRQWLSPASSPSVQVKDFAVDRTNGRVFFTDGTSVRELESTGELPYRSSSEPDTAVGKGIAFQSAKWIFHDPDAGQSYIGDVDSNALIRVDMATGDRSPVSDEETDSPFSLSKLYGDLVVDVAGGRVLAIASDNRLFATDLATSVRSSFASEGDPLEIFFSDIALDKNQGRILVTVPYTESLAAVDLASQNRTILSSADIGSGPAFAHPYSLSLDEKNQVAYVVDMNLTSFALAAVFAVDLQSGDRVILSK